MERHRFDPVSGVFGFVFAAAALVVLLTDEVVLSLEARWVWPAVIVFAGLLLVASGLRSERRDRRRSDAVTTGSAGPTPPL